MCTKWNIEYAQIVTNMQQLLHLCIRDANARACLVTMVEPSRPGRPKLPEWQLSQKSLANRRSLVRSYAKQLHCGHLIAEHAVKRSLNRDRLRARPATFEQLRDTLIAKFTTHDTWEDFIRARRNNDGNGQGVYRTGVTKLMQLLTADMGM